MKLINTPINKNIAMLFSCIFFIVLCPRAFADEIKLKNGWSFERHVDRMTDKNTSFIIKKSVDGNGGLFFKCHSEGQYDPGWALGGLMSSSAEFKYRFDKNNAVDIVSGIMDRNSKLLYLNDVVNFTDLTLKSKLLILQARSKYGDSILQEFNLAGLKSALDYANKTAPCK
jgi:hypothetical protein